MASSLRGRSPGCRGDGGLADEAHSLLQDCHAIFWIDPRSSGARVAMRLTKSTSHAIRILIDCARTDARLVKVAELSERLEITQQNVFKIVNLLARAHLIEAVRGRNGGVRLARPASAIRIGDVVRATEVTHVEIEEGT